MEADDEGWVTVTKSTKKKVRQKKEEENLMEADDEGWVTVTKSTKKKVRNRKRREPDGGK